MEQLKMNMWDVHGNGRRLPGLECLPLGPGIPTSEAQLINNLIRWPYFSHFLPLYASTSPSLCTSLAGAARYEIWDGVQRKVQTRQSIRDVQEEGTESPAQAEH